MNGVFARLGSEWDDFSANAEELLDAGDAVIALGRYRGAHKKTGERINAQFAHVWRLKDGKAFAFQQYADTYQVVRATGR